MKVVLCVLSLLTLLSCDPDSGFQPQGYQKPCSVVSVSGGARITCPDGSSQLVTNGGNGSNGSNGVGVVFTNAQASVSQCSTGGVIYIFASDTQGDGIYHTSDLNQTSSVICNGQNGITPLSVMAPIAPCGPQSSPWKEVLLCLNNGGVLSSFSETMAGLDTRLSFIPSGSYVDTDESGCNFSVSVDGSGNSTVSWGSGSNAYSTWTASSYTCVNNQ